MYSRLPLSERQFGMMSAWTCMVFDIRMARVAFVITDLHYLHGELRMVNGELIKLLMTAGYTWSDIF